MSDDARFAWAVVVPVKVLARAKSRIAPLAGSRRAELALAMVTDTISAVTASPVADRVIVVTDDPVAAAELSAAGATVVPDEPGEGLNEALVHGAASAARRWPAAGIAALSGDLPALRPEEIAVALRAAASWPEAFVPDAQGSGTTLYTAGPGVPFRPAFGLDSRLRHAAGGAAELLLPGIAGLRRDVDTAEDLRAATRLGLGPRTSAVAAELLRAAADRAAGLLAQARAGRQMLTTGQVSVRVMPSTDWMPPVTRRPSSSTFSASARTMTSYGPVTSSAWVTPEMAAICLATSAALPTSVWTRM
jgi:2-phospho-L-lactate guanylyltransferase